MSARFVNIDRETELLFPPNLQDWIGEDELARFIVDSISLMNLENQRINNRGTGSEQYPVKTILSLLIYSYTEGVFGSRRIEKSTYRDIAARFICANTHPDHSTICSFRKKNKMLIEEVFVKILLLAEKCELVKIGNISIDGTKIKANASKHKAVSYEYAKKKVKKLKKDVKHLIQLDEVADAKEKKEHLDIPEELKRRVSRIKKLKVAISAIENELEKKGDDSKTKKSKTEKAKENKKQYNYSDNESNIMKAGNGKHFEQCYNAQASVDTNGSQLILGKHVTNASNDKKELQLGIQDVPAELGKIKKASADNGYFSEELIKKIETESDVKVYVAMGKIKHDQTVSARKRDLKRKTEVDENINSGNFKKRFKRRMQSREGHDFYRLRKHTVEPVFGIIKNVLGFRQFLTRGLDNVKTEWDWITLAYNFKRIHKLMALKA